MMRILSVLIFVSAFQVAFAQFDFNQFLETTSSDPEVELLGEQMGFMKSENFNLPIVRGVEARLRSSNMDEAIEDYRFRLEFLNPFERAANKAFNTSYQTRLEIEREMKFSDALLDRYNVLIDHYKLDFQVRTLTDQRDVLNSMLEMAEKELDAERILKLNLERTKVELDLNKKDGELRTVNDQIISIHGSEDVPNWELFEIISPINMALVLERMDSTDIPVLNWFDHRTELEKKEYVLDRANSRRAIGFIQSEYDWDRGDVPNEHWGFQIGIAIPLVNADRPDLQYKKLDIMERESDAREAYGAFTKEMNELQNKFLVSKSNYEMVVRQEEKLLESGAGQLTDEKLILELLNFKSDIAELKSAYYIEMIQAYVQILHRKGGMKSFNRVNFLSDTIVDN